MSKQEIMFDGDDLVGDLDPCDFSDEIVHRQAVEFCRYSAHPPSPSELDMQSIRQYYKGLDRIS